MNLDNLMQLENIKDYHIWWYGADISDEYLNDDGLINDVIDVRKGAELLKRIYLVMSGINRNLCRYRFAIKLTRNISGSLYEWEKVPLKLDEYAGRLVLRRESGFSFYNSNGKDFNVEEIYGKEEHRTVKQFEDYDSLELSFEELKEVFDNHYADYYKALSKVKGVYMIIDGNTGKLYVGSAYGKDGVWGRWLSYANTCHGDNSELIKLYEQNGERYFHKFKYIILHIFPMRISDREIIEIESRYKRRFLTKEFGLNKN